MHCRRPFKVGLYDVGCGSCKACRITRQEAWVGRLQLELQASASASFWTLTYANDPKSLIYKHVQNWLKRLRRRYSGTWRYFVCGEFGERLNRPHWHVLLFYDRPHPNFSDESTRLWDHGFTMCGPIDRGAIRYTAGYCLKKSLRPPEVRMSLKPGIGLTPIIALGAAAAAESLGRPFERLPSMITVNDKKFPLYGGSRRAFEKGFLQAGGCLVRMAPEEIASMFARSSAELRIQFWNEEEGTRFGMRDLDTIEKDRLQIDLQTRRRTSL